MSVSYNTNAQPIEVDALEERMVVLSDIKKEVSYFKYTGTWAWHDRGDDDTENWNDGFGSFWEAVLDATEPYFEEGDEE